MNARSLIDSESAKDFIRRTQGHHWSRDQILAKWQDITVINDGQVRYPVLTSALDKWTDDHGEINTQNYEDFCENVDCLGLKKVGTPGSSAMTELCHDLTRLGAYHQLF